MLSAHRDRYLSQRRKTPHAANVRLFGNFRTFTATFVPHYDVNQVDGSEACEKTKEGYVGIGEKQVHDHSDGD